MPPVSEPEARLHEYRRRKAAEDRLWELNRIKFKQDLGQSLTETERNTIASDHLRNAASGCQ